jgi:transcriptional regulator with XRE-family HTH domain
MNTTQEPASYPQEGRPLALHIRRLRQWHAEEGLSQAELAELAGISPKLLRRYETYRSLPPMVEGLLAVALALKVPVEGLLAPRHLERLRERVDARRAPRRRRRLNQPVRPAYEP